MIMKIRSFTPVGILAILVIRVLAQSGVSSGFARGDFFIVSSIDLAKRQILLKRPTEVTELMRVDRDTRYLEERGNPIRLTDLRAGDTVYILSKSSGAQPVAVTIHKGPMTLDVLRERFLKRKK
jgi:hypothetical protein